MIRALPEGSSGSGRAWLVELEALLDVPGAAADSVEGLPETPPPGPSAAADGAASRTLACSNKVRACSASAAFHNFGSTSSRPNNSCAWAHAAAQRSNSAVSALNE